MTKYDWGNVPSEVKWIATDKSGFSYGYTRKPFIAGAGAFEGRYSLLLVGFNYQGDGRESLEERPSA